jgi:hypothetical protein
LILPSLKMEIQQNQTQKYIYRKSFDETI